MAFDDAGITHCAEEETAYRRQLQFLCAAGIMRHLYFLYGCIDRRLFGDFIPQMLKVINPESTFTWFWQPLFSPINDIIMVMLGSLALGCVQILVGMVIGFIYKLKHGEIASALCEEAAWWVIIGCGVALGITGKRHSYGCCWRS